MLSLSRKGLLSFTVICVLLSSGLGVYAGYYAGVHGPSPNPNPSQIGDVLTLDDIYYTGEIYQGAGGTALTSAITTKEASYIVWPSGGTYYALNGATGATTSGALASTIINNAITSLTPATAPFIIALKGNFVIDATIELPSYAVLDLRGAALMAKVNLNSAMISITGTTHAKIIGGILDGNGANQAIDCDVITTNPSAPSGRFWIGYGMRIQNAKRDGILLVGSLGANIGTVYLIDIDVEDCIGSGVVLAAYTADCNLNGLNLGANGVSGLLLASSDNNNIVNCLSWNNADKGLRLYDASYNTFTGCRFDWNSYEGIKLDAASNSNIFTGNWVFDNCAMDPTMGAVVVTDSNENQFTGNHIFNGGAMTQKYGIKEEGTSNYNHLVGNNFLFNNGLNGMTDGALLIGAFTTALGNFGYLNENALPATLANDHTATGTKIAGTAGENLVFGNLVYLKSDGKFWKTDANAEATTKGMICLALGTINANNVGTFLQNGLARDDSWAWTVGAPLFISESPGTLTSTAPSDPGDFIRLAAVGGPTGDYLYFNGMNLDWGGI